MAIQPGAIIRVSDIDTLVQTGSELISFSNKDNHTHAVDFPADFAGPPVVTTNIDSGSGPTARWISRAINISPTGFTIFVFASTSGASTSWSDIQVSWTATYRP
ncbi:H-type lectin domain-containing protein [Salininema proteolyticum]|uniref:H-type lectin domain-containing protein n=1 Tax=Salininema proteolyticum TaxID=1607685 RepID=A0ABV8TWP9_9ACTN